MSSLTVRMNDRPVLRCNDRRGLIALGFGLAILFGVVSTPVFIYYYFVPPNQQVRDYIKRSACLQARCTVASPFKETETAVDTFDFKTSTLSQWVQVVPTTLLEKSACKSAFQHWNWFVDGGKPYRNLSIAGCGNYSKAERDLKALFESASTKNLSRSFVQRYLITVCQYVYRQNRTEIRLKCERDEELITEGLSLSCLSVLDCANSVNCPQPLLYTESNFARGLGINCSLPCDEKLWRDSVIINLFYGLSYTSLAILWPCVAVILITCFKVKQMLNYQSITGTLFALSFVIVGIAAMLPDFAGDRYKVYCKHEELIDSWKDPTTICQIQGLMSQFGLISSLMWWASSVCNTLLSLFRREISYSHHHQRKIVFFVQLTLAVLVPGGLTTFSIVRGDTYTMNSYQTVFCTQSSYSSLFYVCILPCTIIMFIGTSASVFVIYGLYRAKKSIYLRQCAANNSEISLSQKRFFLLSIFFPLCFSVVMTSAMIDSKSFVKDIKDDIECLNNTQKECKNDEMTTALFLVLIYALWNSLIFAMVIYCLTQHKEARAYWFQVWKKITSHKWKQKQADEMEVPTENTRLFTSDKNTN